MIIGRKQFVVVCIVTMFLACGKKNATTEHLIFKEAQALGKVENNDINEASGLIMSINNPGYLWTHNDSGDKARIFLLDKEGKDRGEYQLKGIENRDWEDIAIGPGPKEGITYLYIADMGDNESIHDLKYIYRFKEPSPNDDHEIENFDVITFEFPDGRRDAECLMLDPATRDLYIISKREENVGIYIALYPQSLTETIILEKSGSIPYHNIVAGDISPDGREILLKTYDEILYWKRNGEQNLSDLMAKKPEIIPYYKEPQGEAIAWNNDASGFYTLSEEPDGIEAVLYFYGKKAF